MWGVSISSLEILNTVFRQFLLVFPSSKGRVVDFFGSKLLFGSPKRRCTVTRKTSRFSPGRGRHGGGWKRLFFERSNGLVKKKRGLFLPKNTSSCKAFMKGVLAFLMCFVGD